MSKLFSGFEINMSVKSLECEKAETLLDAIDLRQSAYSTALWKSSHPELQKKSQFILYKKYGPVVSAI